MSPVDGHRQPVAAFRDFEPGVAPLLELFGTFPGGGGGGRGNGCRAQPWRRQQISGGGSPRPHGHGHPLHGQDLRGAPQPCGQSGFRHAPGLPMASRPWRTVGGPGRWCDARVLVPHGGPGQRRWAWRHPARPGDTRMAGAADRGAPDPWPGRARFWTASAAENVGPLSALAVGAYIVLAGLWASPISGASMNPARSFGPELAGLNFANFWIYVIGPTVGAAMAVGIAFVLRGPGGEDTRRRLRRRRFALDGLRRQGIARRIRCGDALTFVTDEPAPRGDYAYIALTVSAATDGQEVRHRAAQVG